MSVLRVSKKFASETIYHHFVLFKVKDGITVKGKFRDDIVPSQSGI